MNKVCIIIQFWILLGQGSASALSQDTLRELAASQNVAQVLLANQKAEQEEIEQGLCQQQLKEKQWPVHCWRWLEQQIVSKKISMSKQKKWQSYLNRFCLYLTQQQETPKLRESSSRLWQRSRCGLLAKKYGSGFENEMP